MLKDLAMDLSTTATLEPVMQNGLVASSGVPLVARVYLRLGIWKRALSPSLDDDSIHGKVWRLSNSPSKKKI